MRLPEPSEGPRKLVVRLATAWKLENGMVLSGGAGAEKIAVTLQILSVDLMANYESLYRRFRSPMWVLIKSPIPSL